MTTQETTAFPLCWPYGWQRSAHRSRAKYKVTFSAASKDVVRNLKLLGASHVICSSNLPVKPDGMPYAEERLLGDPGVAVYFERNGISQVMACDKWERAKDNLRAVGLALEAMRQLERCGASEILNRAFLGFAALPPPKSNWREILGVSETSSWDEIERAYKTIRSQAHPDRAGGDAERFNAVQIAFEDAKSDMGR